MVLHSAQKITASVALAINSVSLATNSPNSDIRNRPEFALQEIAFRNYEIELLALPCPTDKATLKADNLCGFTKEEADKINSAIYLLQLAAPHIDWNKRLENINWRAINPSDNDFKDLFKNNSSQLPPVVRAQRKEPILFNLQGKRFEIKDYLLVPTPLSKFSEVSFAVTLAGQLTLDFNNRSDLDKLKNISKMYGTEHETADQIGATIGDQVKIAPDKAKTWQDEAQQISIKSEWLRLHHKANSALFDCLRELHDFSKSPRLIAPDKEVLTKMEEIKGLIKDWQGQSPFTLKDADKLYILSGRLTSIAEHKDFKSSPYGKYLSDKIEVLNTYSDDYNQFLLQVKVREEPSDLDILKMRFP